MGVFNKKVNAKAKQEKRNAGKAAGDKARGERAVTIGLQLAQVDEVTFRAELGKFKGLTRVEDEGLLVFAHAGIEQGIFDKTKGFFINTDTLLQGTTA